MLEKKWAEYSQADTDGDEGLLWLSGLLKEEYDWYGYTSKSIEHERELIRIFPEAPMPHIILASQLHWTMEDLDAAAEEIESAIEKAQADGNFLRHALNTRARIARAREDYSLLEETLKAIMAYRPPPQSQDIGVEKDFLTNLPDGVVSQDVVADYLAYYAARKKPD